MDEASKAPEDAGVDKKWLAAITTQDIPRPKDWSPQDVKNMAAAKPKSRIQAILQEFYFDLIDKMRTMKFAEDGQTIIEAPAEDMFDGFYEGHEIADYPQAFQLFQFFNTIARGLHLNEEQGTGTREDFGKMLRKIAARCVEEPEYVGKVADIINEKYPELAHPFRSEPSVEEMNEQERKAYDEKRGRIVQKIESNIDEFAEQLAKIRRAKMTDFEEIAQSLNRIVIFGESCWELILYGLMSPFAPRIIINSLDYRANLHVMLAGDISTAKSPIMRIARRIAPKALVVDETTQATFEGVAPTRSGDKIEEGVIDWANNGVIIVEEFTSQFTRIPLFRRIMDCQHIVIHKKGSSKPIDVNTTMLTACNPSEDFFLEETNFRKQVPFKEGILSRYWIEVSGDAIADA